MSHIKRDVPDSAWKVASFLKGGGDHLYRNDNGHFTEVTKQAGIHGGLISFGLGVSIGDINNDGYLDVVLGNGSPKMDRMEPMIVMESDGKKFRNITFAAGFPFTGKSHGVNMADLFGDGRLSIMVAAGGAYPGDLLTMNVYYPKSLPGNFLNVRLAGVKCNRSAIGARVTLDAGGRKQYREVGGGSNFGCLPLEQHFGLADITEIDSLEVRWPGGVTQRFTGLKINQTYQFTEGQEQWTQPYPQPAIA